MSSLPPLEPVRFVKKLEDVVHFLGQPLKLECTYSGSQRVSVTWMKDNKFIWASYKYNMKTTDSSCTLEVLNSDRAESAGRYTCQISNAEGSDTCHAHVNIGNNLIPARAMWLLTLTRLYTSCGQNVCPNCSRLAITMSKLVSERKCSFRVFGLRFEAFCTFPSQCLIIVRHVSAKINFGCLVRAILLLRWAQGPG